MVPAESGQFNNFDAEAFFNYTIEQLTKQPSISYPWDKQSIQPTEDAALTNARIIEIIGLPESGKTTVLNLLNEEIKNRIPNIRMKIVPEFQAYRDYEMLKKIYEMGNILAEGFWWAESKYFSYFLSRRFIYDELIKDCENEKRGDPILLVVERGVNDLLAFERALFTLAPNKKLVSPDPHFEQRIKNITTSFILARSVNAVVLYGNSLRFGRKRRKKKSWGRIVTPKMWPFLEYGYSWWLEFVYPWLRENVGTGLQIIDGAENLDENNEQVINYTEQVIKNISD